MRGASVTDQVERVLPRAAWEGVTIEECHETLVRIVETDRILLGDEKSAHRPTLFWLRDSVVERLLRAAASLPDGAKLVIIEGYRTLASQQEGWDQKWRALAREFPDWTDE